MSNDKIGLYDNIHAKRKRIEAVSGERMRSTKNPNSPSAKDFKQAAKTVIKKKKQEIKMPGIMKQAKLKAIMDIISQMDDLEMDRMIPKEMEEKKMYDMEEKPVKKGITIMKLESSKKPKMEMEEEGEEMEEEDDEEIDPLSSLARLKERLKKGRMS